MGCSGSCSGCGGGCGEGADPFAEKMKLIKKTVMVMSGKGGVGKSTVAALLACELARQGKKVGLLDVDFHGPSQPTLFNAQHLRLSVAGETEFAPLEVNGVKLVSIGLILEEPDQAIIWRGPAKIGAMKQLVAEIAWGELDVLVLDFPPGTGDEALSAAQLFTENRTALIVTTPQEVSLADCRKCVDFCRKLELPILGIVENMSYFICPDCDAKHYLFSNGGKRLAEGTGVPLLAQLPLDPEFMQLCDNGNIASYKAESAVGEAARALAAKLAE